MRLSPHSWPGSLNRGCVEGAPAPSAPASTEWCLEARSTSVRLPAVAKISAQLNGIEPLQSSPFLLPFPIRIVLEIVRTVESILGERTSQFSYNTTSLAWRQQDEAFVFDDEDGPVPHVNTKSTS